MFIDIYVWDVFVSGGFVSEVCLVDWPISHLDCNQKSSL